MPSKRESVQSHLFKDSPFFEFAKFVEALNNSQTAKDWPPEKQKFYYDAAMLHSEAKGAKYLSWIAAVQTWDRLRPEKWRDAKILRKVAANVTRQMTSKEVMELREKGLLPDNACWCCGNPWLENGAGGWKVGCQCAHPNAEKYFNKSIVCNQCKQCWECCQCKQLLLP